MLTGALASSVHLCHVRAFRVANLRRHRWLRLCYSIVHCSRHQLFPGCDARRRNCKYSADMNAFNYKGSVLGVKILFSPFLPLSLPSPFYTKRNPSLPSTFQNLRSYSNILKPTSTLCLCLCLLGLRGFFVDLVSEALKWHARVVSMSQFTGQ